MREALELDPLDAFVRFEEAAIYYVARQYDAAIGRAQQLFELDPSYTYTYFVIALARMQQGQYREALDALDRMDPEGTFPDALCVRGYVYAVTGRSDLAHAMLDALDARSDERYAFGFQKGVSVANGQKTTLSFS